MRATPAGGDGIEVVGIGEAMLLLMPDDDRRLAEADVFRAGVAGAELNACATVAALGGRTAFCTRLGDDLAGERIRRTLVDLGIHTGLVRIEEGARTGLLLREAVGGDTGGRDRKVSYHRRGSAAAGMDASDAHRAHAAGPAAVLVSGLTAALGAATSACVQAAVRDRPPGTQAVLDANLRPALDPGGVVAPLVSELLPHLDLLVLGTDEGEVLFGTGNPGSVVASAIEAGAGECVVTGGAAGAWVRRRGGLTHLPATAGRVVDPVGAGDAFTGAYLLARLRGADAVGAARLASDAAALVVGVRGDLAALESIGGLRVPW